VLAVRAAARRQSGIAKAGYALPTIKSVGRSSTLGSW
jgi:hypothetical protein